MFKGGQNYVALTETERRKNMKALSKRLFTFVMIFCMIVPICAQSVSAANSTPNSAILEGGIAIPENERKPFAADSLHSLEIIESDIEDDEGISPRLTPYDRDMGIAVSYIAVCPLLRNLATGEFIPLVNVYKNAVFTNYEQTHGINLSKSETLSMMQRAVAALSSMDENVRVVGWYVECDIEFYYKNPEYALVHRCGTGISVNEEPTERRELNASNPTQTFAALFGFPDGVDFMNDYYYIGISGAGYYVGDSGKHGDALLGAYVSFNN